MVVLDRPFRTLLSREILRFTRIWVQTLIPPLLTSLLYLVVFGVALGVRGWGWTCAAVLLLCWCGRCVVGGWSVCGGVRDGSGVCCVLVTPGGLFRSGSLLRAG
jgi:hypothetical protein